MTGCIFKAIAAVLVLQAEKALHDQNCRLQNAVQTAILQIGSLNTAVDKSTR